MTEATNSDALEMMRYRVNREQQIGTQKDEALISKVADIIFVTADQFTNDNLRVMFRDIANSLQLNKTTLAKAGSKNGSPAAPPQQPDMGQGMSAPPQGMGMAPGP